MILRACVAGRWDNLHQRRFIIFFPDIALFQPLGQMPGTLTVLRAQTHAHGQADTLTDNRAVTIDAFPIPGFFIIHNLVGQCLHIILQIHRIICQVRDFLKNPASALSDRCIDSSHTAHMLSLSFDIFLTICLLLLKHIYAGNASIIILFSLSYSLYIAVFASSRFCIPFYMCACQILKSGCRVTDLSLQIAFLWQSVPESAVCNLNCFSLPLWFYYIFFCSDYNQY